MQVQIKDFKNLYKNTGNLEELNKLFYDFFMNFNDISF